MVYNKIYALAFACFVFSTFVASIASDATCYFPNGDTHDLGVPCRPEAGEGACCQPTHVCLSNGLCLDTINNHLLRVSCTDNTWTEPNCPSFCSNEPSNTWADMRQCDAQDTNWVCGWNVSVCTDSATTTFTVPAGLVSDERMNLTGAVVQVVGMGVASSTGSATTTTTTTTTTATSKGVSGSAKSTTGTEAAIGAGVGVPLFLALVGMVVLYARERRLRMEMMGVAQESPDGAMGMGNGYLDTPKTPVYQPYEQTHEIMSERRTELAS